MAGLIFRVIPGNTSYVCTLEFSLTVHRDLRTRFQIFHQCLVQYNLQRGFKECSRFNAYSVLRGAGWKSLLLLMRDEFSPTKCPLTKPVCLMLTQMHFPTWDGPKPSLRRGGRDEVWGCMCVWHLEDWNSCLFSCVCTELTQWPPYLYSLKILPTLAQKI